MIVKHRTEIEKRGLEVAIISEFEAPREIVFKQLTDPKAIPQWWGPRGLTTTVEKMDVKPGGTWRFIQRDSFGKEYAFNGMYLEVEPFERLVYTFEYEGEPGHIQTEHVELVDIGGATKVVDSVLFKSIEERDGMLKAGMEYGSIVSMERFAELLEQEKMKTV